MTQPFTRSGDARRTAMLWVFPALVITEVVSSQPWYIGSLQPGQLLGWVNIALFAVVIFLTPRRGAWARGLVAVIFMSKMGAWLTGMAALDALYRLSLVTTAAIIGTMIAVEHTADTRRQATLMMLVSAPLMFLQVSGAGEWTQFLTTHGIKADGTSASKAGTPTLFVPTRDLIWQGVQNVQSRPAGFFHASEFASLIIIFAFVLILASRGRRSRVAEVAVAAAAVLSMAKIVLLTASVAALWILWKGEPSARQRARSLGLLLVGFLFAYRVVFPGLFDANLGREAFALSLLSRAHDVVSVLGFGALADRQLYAALEARVEFAEGESLSGIGQLVRYLPAFLGILAVGTPVLMLAFRRTKGISRGATQLASTMLFSVSLFLVAGPFIKSTVFWFCMGFGLFPLQAVLGRDYLKHMLSRLEPGFPREPPARNHSPDLPPRAGAEPA